MSAHGNQIEEPATAHPLKILLLEDNLGDDGATRANLRLASHWQDAGADVRLFVLGRPEPGFATTFPPGLEILHPTAQPRRLRHAALPGAARLLRLARQADVVVAGREIDIATIAVWGAARVARRPFAVLIRSDPGAAIQNYVPARRQGLSRRALAAADALICVSPGLAPATRALGAEPEAVRVVLDGIDVREVLAAGAEEPPAGLLPEGDGPLVVAVGRLERQKGFDVLIRALARVRETGGRARLLILGEGGDRQELQALAEEVGIADSLWMPGNAPALPVIARADLFCLPSRWEGLPLALCEAVVLGVPSVAADCVSGPRLLLADGRYGDLVPVDDVDALAAAVRRHLEQPERLRRAAREGQAWGVEHLDMRRAAAGFLDELQRLVGNLRGTAATRRRRARPRARREPVGQPGEGRTSPRREGPAVRA